jgi:hypothetical protein
VVSGSVCQKCHRKILEIISLEEAQSKGSKFYFTGKPCKHGHIAPKYVKYKYVCVECEKLRCRIKSRVYYWKNPAGIRAKANANRASNLEREREKERIRETRRKPRDPQKVKEWHSNGIKRNPEKYRLMALRRSTKYAKAHLEERAAIENRRRARKLSQTCTCCTNEQLLLAYKQAAEIGGHVDHIIPLALGGLHCLKNLQVLTKEQHKEKTKGDLSIIVKLQKRNPTGEYIHG